jgi:hypothetical protein
LDRAPRGDVADDAALLRDGRSVSLCVIVAAPTRDAPPEPVLLFPFPELLPPVLRRRFFLATHNFECIIRVK